MAGLRRHYMCRSLRAGGLQRAASTQILSFRSFIASFDVAIILSAILRNGAYFFLSVNIKAGMRIAYAVSHSGFDVYGVGDRSAFGAPVFRQAELEGQASELAVLHRNCAAVGNDGVLHDGKAQSCATGFTRAARVDAVETFEEVG